MAYTLASLLLLCFCLLRQVHPDFGHAEQTLPMRGHGLRQLPAFLGVLPICVRILHGERKRAGCSRSSQLSTERFTAYRVSNISFLPEAVCMPTRGVERYKEYAAECLRIAQQTMDEAQKARLLEMAEAWQRLAEAAGRQDQK